MRRRRSRAGRFEVPPTDRIENVAGPIGADQRPRRVRRLLFLYLWIAVGMVVLYTAVAVILGAVTR